MIYLTGDPHFGHSRIIRYVNRPFSDVEEMDRVIIKNFNETLNEDDTLYILGDFTMGGSYTKCKKYLDQINCKHVHLILGNHDKRFVFNGKKSPFESEHDYYEIRGDYRMFCMFCLSHYPMLSWHGRDYGSIMCHGHIHSNGRSNDINRWQGVRRYDVGVDANDYKPVSIEHIWNFFEWYR